MTPVPYHKRIPMQVRGCMKAIAPIRIPFTLVCALVLPSACSAATNSEAANPAAPALDLPPEMRILEAADLNDNDCYPETSPGRVNGDFNVDGLMDYAVMLVSRKTGGSVKWNDEVLHAADFKLLVFLAQGGGTFRKFALWDSSGYLPGVFGIKPQPRGRVTPSGSDKGIELKAPAIKWFACGKSSAIYYWTGSGFSEFWLSD